MNTYIILSKISSGDIKNPYQLNDVAESVTSHIKQNCPDARWKQSYAVRGQYDIIDIVETINRDDIDKIVMILRT